MTAGESYAQTSPVILRTVDSPQSEGSHGFVEEVQPRGYVVEGFAPEVRGLRVVELGQPDDRLVGEGGGAHGAALKPCKVLEGKVCIIFWPPEPRRAGWTMACQTRLLTLT